MNPHIFFDEYEWYVAQDLEDAKQLQREFTSCSAEDQVGADWQEIPDDADLIIWFRPDQDDSDFPLEAGEVGHGIPVIGTAEAWIEDNGRGFLCGTEC